MNTPTTPAAVHSAYQITAWADVYEKECGHGLLVQMLRAYAAIAATQSAAPTPASQIEPCKLCDGTKVVSDGEITHSEGGIRYENGPVICIKDCPVCASQPAAPIAPSSETAQPRHIYHYLLQGNQGPKSSTVDGIALLVEKVKDMNGYLALKNLACEQYPLSIPVITSLSYHGMESAAPPAQAAQPTDAERYQWLRGEANRDYVEFNDAWYELDTDLDEAIDAAITASKGGA